MRGVAGTVRKMVEALGHDRIDVLGVWLRGAVAQRLAHQAPSLVRRLVLAATGPGLGGVPAAPTALLALATPRRYHRPTTTERIAGRVYGGAARADPDLFCVRLGRPRPSSPPLRGYLGQLYAIAGWTSLPGSTASGSQRLIIAGDDDPIIPSTNGRILARSPRRPAARRRGGGHLFLLERPSEMATLVAVPSSGPATSPAEGPLRGSHARLRGTSRPTDLCSRPDGRGTRDCLPSEAWPKRSSSRRRGRRSAAPSRGPSRTCARTTWQRPSSGPRWTRCRSWTRATSTT